jgi:hypothetical protein
MLHRQPLQAPRLPVSKCSYSARARPDRAHLIFGVSKQRFASSDDIQLCNCELARLSQEINALQ